jgi:hypothetical protein
MEFVQLIEFHSNKFDEFLAMEREWETATEGKRTTRRRVVGRDRQDPSRYVMIVFFDSYESAMENSKLAATDKISSRMAALADSGTTFSNLDVVEDRAG